MGRDHKFSKLGTIWLIPNIQGNSWKIVFVQYLLNVMIQILFASPSRGSANSRGTIWLVPNIHGNSWTIVFVQYLLNVCNDNFIFASPSTGSANLTGTIWLIPNIQGNSWTIVFVQYLLNVMIHHWVIHDDKNSGALFGNFQIFWESFGQHI